ncbi:tRNA lysidine(34) synthetase TilS [Citreimonas salinaria]|uniref:tRNA(Ile)-lysidine synthase n=1 Tax=Citreimonas salinaria TaxID=321339 RepID=A0A1H3JA03_9RHOB|nr:tRNA(Ile)-lysidine synthase [Citreimonas salinaria]
MGDLLGPDFPADIGLAVSGGGDSMAMLTLAHNWTRAWGVRLWVVTVDHRLRPESADEAAMVARECAALGWPQATLRWHWDGTGNKMDAARRGRLELIGAWRGALRHVLMAHTRDDVAETFLMRLARGSGVEGLSAMAAMRRVRPLVERATPADYDGALPPRPVAPEDAAARDGFDILRPCLDMKRAELRHYLRSLKGTWVEDPSNDDPGYDRVRMRRLLALLEDEGLGADSLAATAGRMARARQALAARARAVWHEIGHEGSDPVTGAGTGDILFDRDGFAATERDTQLRLLAAALQFISGAEYRPRAAPLGSLLDRLLGGGGGTLHGVEARVLRDRLHLFREYEAVRDLSSDPANGLWDGRWRVEAAEDAAGLTIRALGDAGWAQLPGRPAGTAFAAARPLPALWHGDRLLSCPPLGFGAARATLCPTGRPGLTLSAFLDSH